MYKNREREKKKTIQKVGGKQERAVLWESTVEGFKKQKIMNAVRRVRLAERSSK